MDNFRNLIDKAIPKDQIREVVRESEEQGNAVSGKAIRKWLAGTVPHESTLDLIEPVLKALGLVTDTEWKALVFAAEQARQAKRQSRASDPLVADDKPSGSPEPFTGSDKSLGSPPPPPPLPPSAVRSSPFWQMMDRVRIPIQVLRIGVVVLLIVAGGGVVYSRQSGTPLAPLKLAVPFYLDPPNHYWDQLDQAAPTVGLVSFGADTRPGTAISSAYVSQVHSSQAAGIGVLGHVYVDYGTLSLAYVQAEIDRSYRWYHPDGILLDPGADGSGGFSSCAIERNYYLPIYKYIKAKNSKALVVLSRGTQTLECFMSAADILITFYDNYSAYHNNYPIAPSWVVKYPANRFWQIVENTPSVAAMQDAVTLARQRHVGWLWVDSGSTNLVLPGDPFWSAEIKAVKGGS